MKEALLILDDSNINNSDIKFVVSRKYCVYSKIYIKDSSATVTIEKGFKNGFGLIVCMEKILKEFEFCVKIKSIGKGNMIQHAIVNEEYFSAIYVNGELYLKVEDDENM